MAGVRPEDYRNLLHSMEDGFCLLQLLFDADNQAVDYVFLDLNRAYEQHLGVDGAKGKRMREVAPTHAPWLDMYRDIDRTGAPRRFEMPAQQDHRRYEGSAYRVGTAQQHTIAVLVREMPERPGREEVLAEVNRALEQQLAQRSQELAKAREQLEGMASELTLAEQRERKRLGTELYQDLAERLLVARIKLGRIHQSGTLDASNEGLLKEADKLLTRALAFAYAGVADLSPLVLQDLGLPSAITWLAERMEQQGLEVTVRTTVPDTLPLPEAHAACVFQSVRELLMNVLKHANCRGASVHMALTAGTLQIDVQDEGVGFNHEPADGSSRPSTFGLPAIRERIEALGGTFRITSRLEEGTTATVTLPVESAALEEASRSKSDEHKSPSGKTRPTHEGIIRVLLVDDHAMMRQGLKSVLNAYADMKVVGEAADGNEAVQLTGELLPMVVLMDINMPGCNGIEATRRITGRYPHIKVIGLSVDADGHNQEAMLQAGAYSLMTKEAAIEQLYGQIYEAVKPGVTPFTPLR